MRVFNKAGQAQHLADEIARGGEGAVHTLVARPSVVVKLYHPELRARRGAQTREKINAMVAMRGSLDTSSLAWPAIAVYDDQGAWCGYAMSRAGGVPLAKVAHPMLYRKHVPGLDRSHLVRMLVGIVRTLGRLHDASVCLGDINLNNFLYDHASGVVTLIDCDSYQVTVGERTYPCLVIAPDMMPPEHHGVNLAQVRRTPESDFFSLAILIFRCLMLGRHPYDFVGGGTVVENLCRGHFPYGPGGAAPGREGAFTGANSDRKGHFELADGGTIFLDEIGELAKPIQVKLLRALQEGEVTAVGSSEGRKIDVRIIAATNRTLVNEVANGNFREDLFYRLAVAIIKLPPLRERAGDISLLIEALMKQVNEAAAPIGIKHKKISVGGRNVLLQHDWRGNVRELLNTLQRAAVWSDDEVIGQEAIKDAIMMAPKAPTPSDAILNRRLDDGINLQELMAGVARHYLERALDRTKGNKTQAAKILGFGNYQTLTNWLNRYGIER